LYFLHIAYHVLILCAGLVDERTFFIARLADVAMQQNFGIITDAFRYQPTLCT
jgi:hypothetical protein